MFRLTILIWGALLVFLPNIAETQENNAAIQFRIPDPAITAIHVDAFGHIVRVDFADGGHLDYPVEITPEELKNIDLIDIYTIPFELINYRELGDETGENRPIFDRVRFLKHWFRTFGEEMKFGEIIEFDQSSAEMLSADGEENLQPIFENANLNKIEIIDIIDFRLIEYIDLNDGYKKRKILRLSLNK